MLAQWQRLFELMKAKPFRPTCIFCDPIFLQDINLGNRKTIMSITKLVFKEMFYSVFFCHNVPFWFLRVHK